MGDASKAEPFSRAPHMTEADGLLGAWFTDPPGAVVRFLRSAPGTLDGAKWMTGPALSGLQRRFPGRDDFVLVMDLTLMTGRDPAVRAFMREQARLHRSVFGLVVLVPPATAGPVYLASLRTAIAVLSVFGVAVEFREWQAAIAPLREAAP